MIKLFTVGRLLISLGWARSGTWSITCSNEERIHFISIHTIKKDKLKALSLILGPISVIVGVI